MKHLTRLFHPQGRTRRGPRLRPLAARAASSLRLLACAIALGTLCACHSSEEPEPKPTEQTILFYFPWSGNDTPSGGYNNLYNIFLSNIAEIKRAITERQTMANARLIVCLASERDQATLTEVVMKRTGVTQDTLKTYTGVDFTQAETIRQIISDAKAQAPAERYALMIGCHGMGWIPRQEEATNRQEVRRRYFGGLVSKFQTDIKTLVQAIEQTQTHMDFILFDDCYMANVEVAYDLRGVTDFLIASTSEIMARGLPYDRMWNHLSPNPNYAMAVQEFLDYYLTYTYPYGTLSAIDCREAEAMATLMREANYRHTLDPTEADQIQRLDGYTPTIFFDMGDYIDHLCEGDDQLLDQLHAQLQRLVPHTAATPYIYSVFTSRPIHLETFSGITISDPTTSNSAHRKEQTDWWQATH